MRKRLLHLYGERCIHEKLSKTVPENVVTGPEIKKGATQQMIAKRVLLTATACTMNWKTEREAGTELDGK